MANVDKDACKEFRTALGREIGETKKKAEGAQKCAQNKVEKTNFRWTIGIMIVVLGAVLTFISGMVVYNGRTVNASENKVAGMEGKVDATKEKVDGLERDHREWRTEQRTLNDSTQRKLDEIKDLVKPR